MIFISFPYLILQFVSGSRWSRHHGADLYFSCRSKEIMQDPWLQFRGETEQDRFGQMFIVRANSPHSIPRPSSHLQSSAVQFLLTTCDSDDFPKSTLSTLSLRRWSSITQRPWIWTGAQCYGCGAAQPVIPMAFQCFCMLLHVTAENRFPSAGFICPSEWRGHWLTTKPQMTRLRTAAEHGTDPYESLQIQLMEYRMSLYTVGYSLILWVNDRLLAATLESISRCFSFSISASVGIHKISYASKIFVYIYI